MKSYALLFRGGLDFSTASPGEIQQAMMKWQVWMDEMTAEGKMGVGERLLPNGKVLTGAQRQVSDGPFVEGKEIVGGYLEIKSADLDEAVELAKGCPIFDFNGFVEVREIVKM